MTRRFLYYSELLVRLLPERDYAIHLEALAEALPIEVTATDGAGHVIVWNRSMERVAGHREQALGKALLDALPWLRDDPNRDWSEVLADVLAGGEASTFARVPLGGRVVRATIAPMRGAADEVLGAVLALEDITHGTRAEEERRIRERALAVHDLGAGIAHEVRNPLNALSLNLQLLRERLDDPDIAREEIRERTDRMIAETQRVERLVEHLLEVSRRDELERSGEGIDTVLRGVVERMEGMAERLACRIEFNPGSSRVLALDRVRMERALHNLVRNALEAAAEGGGHVWITTRDDPHTTVIVIDDDGPGIKPEDRSRVFVIYTTGKRGGTGLGLPLAREDIVRHGGEIEVLSRPGGGARFVVYLPIESDTTPSQEDPWPAS